jgi:hypothetical protein
MYQDGSEEPFFRVITKRLVSFEQRNVLTTDNMYSVETMLLLTHLFDSFMEEPIVRKAINPFTKFEKWQTTITELPKTKSNETKQETRKD